MRAKMTCVFVADLSATQFLACHPVAAWRRAPNRSYGIFFAAILSLLVVDQRLCGSGMKWTEDGAAVDVSLRALSYTPERWDQFWLKVDRWGFPVAA